jgi:hypothetical protein
MEITSCPKLGRHAKEPRWYKAITITSIGVENVVAGCELVNGTGWMVEGRPYNGRAHNAMV